MQLFSHLKRERMTAYGSWQVGLHWEINYQIFILFLFLKNCAIIQFFWNFDGHRLRSVLESNRIWKLWISNFSIADQNTRLSTKRKPGNLQMINPLRWLAWVDWQCEADIFDDWEWNYFNALNRADRERKPDREIHRETQRDAATETYM